MAPVPQIFPASIEAVLTPIASLSDSAYEYLRAEVEGKGAFEDDNDRRERLGRALGVMLAALDFLYGRMRTLPGANSSEVIGRFVEGFEGKLSPEEREKLQSRLSVLTTPKESVEVARKIRRLRTGFLDNATAFSSFVDLRPDFLPGYNDVRALVPIVQLMISTDAEDVTRRHAVFQLDERALAGLRTVVEQAEKKLETLKQKGVGKLEIVFQTSGDDAP